MHWGRCLCSHTLSSAEGGNARATVADAPIHLHGQTSPVQTNVEEMPRPSASTADGPSEIDADARRPRARESARGYSSADAVHFRFYQTARPVCLTRASQI